MKKTLLILAIISTILAACTFPSAGDDLSAEEIAQTMVAETEAAAPTETTAPINTPTATAEAEKTATPMPTSSAPLVSVSVATNCRTGPDVVYPLVLVFQPGASEEIVGKYSDGGANYWIIKTPSNETCWLWGEYASITGDTSAVPELAPPAPPAATATQEGVAQATATPTLAIIVVGPPAPGNFSASADCTILDMGNDQKLIQAKIDTITWTSSNGATGYKVYVNGVEEKDLNANATGTTFDAIAMSSNQYGVAAYNGLGTSSTVTIPAPSCP